MTSFLSESRVDLFWTRVSVADNDSDCWPWLGTLRSKENPYGVFRSGGRRHPSHRLAWEFTFGPIPEGMSVCHRCDNPPCCNPAHLFLGTNLDNIADRHNKGRDASGLRNGKYTRPAATPRGTRHGRHTKPQSTARGERHGFAKLSENDVRRILDAYARGIERKVIAQEFGVGYQAIWDITKGRSWTHIKPNESAIKAVR